MDSPAPKVTLTNADKVLYPATGTTKADVFDYYTAIAEVMLPHIAGRPVTRKRWPNGVDAAGVLREATGVVGTATGCTAAASPTGPAPPPIRSSTASTGWPGSRSRRRWKCMCRNGGSSTPKARPGNAVGVRPRSRRRRDDAAAVRGRPRGPGPDGRHRADHVSRSPAAARACISMRRWPSRSVPAARRCWPNGLHSNWNRPCRSWSPRR